MIQLMIDVIDTPLGPVHLVADETAVCGLWFTNRADLLKRDMERRFGAAVWRVVADPNGFSSRIRAYFGGEVDALTEIPVAMRGSEFQIRVWTALRAIPSGRTTSYGTIAAQLGMPTASRAVGAANGANPIAIIVPCHRVIGANATLTGYAGGLHRKRWLLEHEGVVMANAGGQLDAFAEST